MFITFRKEVLKEGGYTLKPKLQPKLEKILAGLTEQEKDDIYSHLCYQHVLQDCYDFCEQENLSASDETLEQAATLYVYDGDYECNLPYWLNIANVIEKASN